MIAIGNYCMSAEIAHVPKKNSEGTRKKRWMMSERIGSCGWRIWKEKGLPQEVVPLSDAEGVVAQLEEENETLKKYIPEHVLKEWEYYSAILADKQFTGGTTPTYFRGQEKDDETE